MEEIKKPGETEAHRFLSKLQGNDTTLFINRLPPKTREKFVKIANDEFCGDYGMTLKFLVDGLLDENINILVESINEIESRVEILENKKTEVKKVTRKMCDGTEKVIGK